MTATLTKTICHRCGHTLTSGVYGGKCEAKIHHAIGTADLHGYTGAQIAKAIELVEMGGIIPIGHLFLAVSSSGAMSYETAATGECSCMAAAYGRKCYHVLAARIFQATLTD